MNQAGCLFLRDTNILCVFSSINVFICLTKVTYLMVTLMSLTISIITQLEIQTILLCQGHIMHNLREVYLIPGIGTILILKYETVQI